MLIKTILKSNCLDKQTTISLTDSLVVDLYLLGLLEVLRLHHDHDLVISDGDISVGEHCSQVPDNDLDVTKDETQVVSLVPVHQGVQLLELAHSHGVVHGRGVPSLRGRRHHARHLGLEVEHLVCRLEEEAGWRVGRKTGAGERGQDC